MTDVKYTLEHRPVAPGVDLHLHQTDKSKTSKLVVHWLGDLDSSVTARALLPSVLCRGTESHPDMRSLSRKLEMLYGASLSGDVSKVGTRHIITFRMDFPGDDYLPAGESVLADAVALAADVMYRPHLVDGAFPVDVVEQERVNLDRHIASLINDKSGYALQRCLASCCPDEAYRRYEYGSQEDLAAISGADLLSLWREQSSKAPMHVYFSGDVAPDVAADALAPLFGGERQAPTPLADVTPVAATGDVRVVEEELPVSQAQLIMAYRTGVRFGDPGADALAMANGILGQFSHSKLFQNVREKESLCYSVNSSLDRAYGMGFITAGIDVDTKDRALDVIGEQLTDLKAGRITDEELAATRLAYANRLVMLEDNASPLFSIDLVWRLAGAEYDHARYLERLQAVTLDEIVAASQAFELDTVYLLKPGEESLDASSE